MPTYTLDEYAALLTRTFTPRFPRDCRPRAASDVTDKGIPVMEFLLPHPEASQRSITLSASERRGMVESTTLRIRSIPDFVSSWNTTFSSGDEEERE